MTERSTYCTAFKIKTKLFHQANKDKQTNLLHKIHALCFSVCQRKTKELVHDARLTSMYVLSSETNPQASLSLPGSPFHRRLSRVSAAGSHSHSWRWRPTDLFQEIYLDCNSGQTAIGSESGSFGFDQAISTLRSSCLIWTTLGSSLRRAP